MVHSNSSAILTHGVSAPLPSPSFFLSFRRETCSRAWTWLQRDPDGPTAYERKPTSLASDPEEDTCSAGVYVCACREWNCLCVHFQWAGGALMGQWAMARVQQQQVCSRGQRSSHLPLVFLTFLCFGAQAVIQIPSNCEYWFILHLPTKSWSIGCVIYSADSSEHSDIDL